MNLIIRYSKENLKKGKRNVAVYGDGWGNEESVEVSINGNKIIVHNIDDDVDGEDVDDLAMRVVYGLLEAEWEFVDESEDEK